MEGTAIWKSDRCELTRATTTSSDTKVGWKSWKVGNPRRYSKAKGHETKHGKSIVVGVIHLDCEMAHGSSKRGGKDGAAGRA
jgi:hypothetical protein